MVTEPTNQSSVPSARHDLSDLGSEILIRILPKERTQICCQSNFQHVRHQTKQKQLNQIWYMSVLFFMLAGSYEALFPSHKVRSLSRKLVFQSWNTFGVSNQSLTRATEVPYLLRWRNLKTEVSLREHIKCFPSTLRDRIWKRNNHLSSWICVWWKLRKGNQVITEVLTFSNWKPPFSKCFSLTLKRKAAVFKFLQFFEECFRKAAFSWRISVDGRPIP